MTSPKARPACFAVLVEHCTIGHRHDCLRAALIQWARFLACPTADPMMRMLLYDAARLSLTDAAAQEARGYLFDQLRLALASMGDRPLPIVLEVGDDR